MAPSTKATQKRLEAAVAAFNTRYSDSQQWGHDRWFKSLYPALALPTTYTAVINQYSLKPEDAIKNITGSSEPSEDLLEFVELPLQKTTASQHVLCYRRTSICDSGADSRTRSLAAAPFPPPKSSPYPDNKLLTHWNMDAASVIAAHMLDVRAGDRVLDMCAAPGGKSVVLAQRLFPHLHQTSLSTVSANEDTRRSCLHVNELDTTRFKRLAANLRAYLPASLFPTPENPQALVRILNEDLSSKSAVSLLPYGVNGYDKILVDAPCSSERHIIHAYEKVKMTSQVADEMLNWKSSHITTLAKIQVGLLHTAVKAIKLGGRIVYATCALGVEENDGVVEKVLEILRAERKKAKRDGSNREQWDIQCLTGSQGDQSSVDDLVLESMTENTKYGRIALPDHGGHGPLFFSIMVKVSRKKKTPPKTTAEPPAGDEMQQNLHTECQVEKSLQRLQLEEATDAM